MKRKTIDIITLGCSKNLVDSEHLMRQLEEVGFHVTHDAERPKGQIAVINTRITLHYPHMSIDNRKRAIAMDNHSFQERIRENDSIYVDIDFFDIEKKLGLPPSLDDGLFLKWEIAKRRFMEHIIEDNQGLHTLDTENADDLRLSKRTFGQLYCIYILMHNETIRNKE